MAYNSILIVALSFITIIESRWRPCVEVNREFRIPCQCDVAVSGLNKSTLGLEINCDRVILAEDSLASLASQPVISFSQKFSGHRYLPTQLINILPDTLEKLDLSDNAINRLMNRQLQGHDNLKELNLANNALGDNLNPIFSSNIFHEISNLRILNLRLNGLRSIEEGIFKECIHLEELYLDYNYLDHIPIKSLNGPRSIRVLSLAGNNIGTIKFGALSVLGETLLSLDISKNELLYIEDGALIGMTSLLIFNLSFNDIRHLNSDVFKGAYSLQQLDMSNNLLEEFPTEALRYQKDLRFFNVSNNLITELECTDLANFPNLQILDLSRNNIGRLGIHTFSELKSLVQLDLSFNALRAIEESSFEGLSKLRWLSLQDNNILLVPSAALARLPSLSHLHLEFNRIAALSSEILQGSASRLITFSLTRNLVRELPAKLFFNFKRLTNIELSGNMIPVINQQSFIGVEETLIGLDLSYNRLSEIGELPLRYLVSLNLAGNLIKRVSPDTFKHLNHLQYLNISDNPLYGGFPPFFPSSLISLDVSRTDLHILPTVLLLNLKGLEKVSFADNKLKKIEKNTFEHLYNLTEINLSFNEIRDIDKEAFVGLQMLYHLNLHGNKLKSFEGEFFDTGTGLELLDLSDNELEYLSPTSFLIHPRLRRINLSKNRFTTFNNELIKTLQFLEYLNLSDNELYVVDEFAFAQIPLLRELNLSDNLIRSVNELAFHNSTQLQRLDLSKNRIESLSERMIEGILRMQELNLMDNYLTSLPDTIFDLSRVRSLEEINLSGNRFAEIPRRALLKQVINLKNLNIARNRLSEMFTQDIISTVKYLDVSRNPLSESAIDKILKEAKVFRYLNLASCGIKRIIKIEAPFLRHLNLSNNTLESIAPYALERTTMLEELDVSRNRLRTFDGILGAFGTLKTLKMLDISGNDVNIVNESSLVGFDNLRTLKMFNLANCTRIEKNAFKSFHKLKNLQAYDFPRLGYFDVRGILKVMINLEVLDIEIKDLNAGNEQISVRMHPRLKSLSLRGERLRNVLSSLLVGTRSSKFSLGFKNTSIETIPTTLLFPVPRSTLIELDVSGSKFKTISPQLMSAFEERSGAIKLTGLKITARCDCQAKNLWKVYKNLVPKKGNSVMCISPESLIGQYLEDLTEEQLSCEPRKSTTAYKAERTESTSSTRRLTTSEPEIIWTVAPTSQDSDNIKQNNGESPLNASIGTSNGTDDTLIIGIVGGVVAFIAIVVIIICICRLRWSSQMADARVHSTMAPSIHEASMLRPASTYSGKLANQDLYIGSYNGSTLGHTNANAAVIPATTIPITPMHMMPYMQPLPIINSSANPQPIYGYYDNSPAPIYITTSSENKFER